MAFFGYLQADVPNPKKGMSETAQIMYLTAITVRTWAITGDRECYAPAALRERICPKKTQPKSWSLKPGWPATGD